MSYFHWGRRICRFCFCWPPSIRIWHQQGMAFDWALAAAGHGLRLGLSAAGRAIWFCLVALLPSSIGPGISKVMAFDSGFLGLGSQHEHAFWLGLEVSVEARGFVLYSFPSVSFVWDIKWQYGLRPC